MSEQTKVSSNKCNLCNHQFNKQYEIKCPVCGLRESESSE